MQLPILKVIPGQPVEFEKCIGTSQCDLCSLYKENGGRCNGCTPQVKKSLTSHFKGCYKTECNACTGHKYLTAAICCRSPMKHLYLNAVTGNPSDWNKPVFNFKKRPILTFKQKAILSWSFGSPTRLAPDRSVLFEDHEIVSLSLPYIKGKGDNLVSSDLKKHFKLSPKTKLLVSTFCQDDALDKAWDKEHYGGSYYTQSGVDYWMPLCFTTQGTEASMFIYYQFMRQMRSAEKGKAWFTLGNAGFLDVARFEHTDLFQAWVEAMPQVVFSTQFVTSDDKTLRPILVAIKKWDSMAPKDVPFWFYGGASPTLLHNIRKVIPDRDKYYVSPKPIYTAVSGKWLTPTGADKKAPFDIPRDELLDTNIRVYQEMVRTHGL